MHNVINTEGAEHRRRYGWANHAGSKCNRCGFVLGPWYVPSGQELWGCADCGVGVACGDEGQPSTDAAADVYMSLVR